MKKITANNNIIAITILIVLLGIGVFAADYVKKNVATPDFFAFDPQNATYDIAGADVTLMNGKAEIEDAPGSASKTVTKYFGNEAAGDLDGDGTPDRAFLITQDEGGSGIFYFVVAVLKTSDGYMTTSAMFLGDRIAPQTTEIKDSKLYVNYADRKETDSMSTQPSVNTTRTFKISSAGELYEL